MRELQNRDGVVCFLVASGVDSSVTIKKPLRHRIVSVVLIRLCAVGYFVGLAISVFTPRLPSAPWGSPHHSWMHWIHNVLYLSGAGEVIGNYFIYAPIVFLSSFLFPRLSLGYRVLLGCAASGLVELTQLVIPGRVSSLRDFVTNCAGVVIAGLIERLLRRIR